MLLGGSLHVAELPPSLHRVLDCGTGTGIWAIDMAEYERGWAGPGSIEGGEY